MSKFASLPRVLASLSRRNANQQALPGARGAAPCEAAGAALGRAMADGDSQSQVLFVVGILVALAAGAATALSMVIQRGVLSYPADRIPLKVGECSCGSWGKNKVWVGGLLLYAVATGGLYSVAGLFISLALLSSLFITLLVFNLYFSRVFLKEQLTRPKVAGSIIIIAGASLSACAASVGIDSVKVEYTSDEVAQLYAAPAGAAWFGLLVAATLGTLCAILVYERRYPLRADGTCKPGNEPPPALDSLMGLVYPASLGLDEAGDASAKTPDAHPFARIPRADRARSPAAIASRTATLAPRRSRTSRSAR